MMPEARVTAPISASEASRIARELYDLDALARPLPGEYDDNFRLEIADGRCFVLKIMHPAREASLVDMQARALTHLQQRAPQLALPRVIPSRAGNVFTQLAIEGGASRLVWLLTFLPGKTLAETNPHSPELLASLGQLLAELDSALLNFSHAGASRELKWDLSRTLSVRPLLPHIRDPLRRSLAAQFLDLFELQALPKVQSLRRSVIYGDANDHNVLVSAPRPRPQRVLSVIDFGDMHLGLTVGEPAVAAAYAMLAKPDPLAAASALLSGYHKVLPLTEDEVSVFFALACARLAVSVINSAHRQTLITDDPYVTASEALAWAALERLTKIHPRLAHYTFRAACGLPPVPQASRVRDWLARSSAADIIPIKLREGNCLVLDLSIGSTFLGANPADAPEPVMTAKIQEATRAAGAAVAIGRYDEPRSVYSTPNFAASANPTDERRTIHLGLDLFVPADTPVSAPFDGTIHSLADNAVPQDYGPVVILQHQPDDAPEFFTLYGHLSRESLSALRIGAAVQSGDIFAKVGAATENGGWSPHLHVQVILDLLDCGTDFPGVAFASQRSVFTSLSPDPNLILNISPHCFPPALPSVEATLDLRKRLLGPNLSVSYRNPLKMVRGWRQYLYDHTGRAFLDVYNNVPLVGHCHPRVVQAASEQLALLNTNTRYLHDNVLRYAERLTALFPSPLKVCFFVNSGTEANEVALRLARAHTSCEDVIVLEHAYHGHTSSLIDISPYKFDGPGGRGRKPWVHVAPIPDDYRGIHRRGEPNLGITYAAYVGTIVEGLKRKGKGVAAFIAETLPSVAGQILFPPGYLEAAYKQVRAAGGVCIADEVQVGFGRLGSHFWGFETQGVVPDIVVLGKPIGNGFPVAAVITSPDIAASFANGMEFFSTFGGNPVACSAGLAVLDVLHDEHLQENARTVGSRWLSDLRGLQSADPVIGDVRGAGLFLGIELVNDRQTRSPAFDQAAYIVNRLRECGILCGTDGPRHNVIKLRPPLIFSREDAELFTSTLRAILDENAAQPN